MDNTGNHDTWRPKQPRLPTLVTKVTTNVFRSSYKLSVILSYFNQNWNVSTDFGEDPQQLPSRNFLQKQSSCSKQNNRQKEMTKTIGCFSQLLCYAKEYCWGADEEHSNSKLHFLVTVSHKPHTYLTVTYNLLNWRIKRTCTGVLISP
jgi:hypothetical protein